MKLLFISTTEDPSLKSIVDNVTLKTITVKMFNNSIRLS